MNKYIMNILSLKNLNKIIMKMNKLKKIMSQTLNNRNLKISKNLIFILVNWISRIVRIMMNNKIYHFNSDISKLIYFFLPKIFNNILNSIKIRIEMKIILNFI